VHHLRRNLYEQQIFLSDEEFIDHPVGRRVLPGVAQDQFDHPLDADEVIRLLLVHMPRFDDSWAGRGEIELAKSFEDIPITSEEFGQVSPFIHDPVELPG
jgi:hypothetical protein